MAGYKNPYIDKFLKKKIMGIKKPMTTELNQKSPEAVARIPAVRPTTMRNLGPLKGKK